MNENIKALLALLRQGPVGENGEPGDPLFYKRGGGTHVRLPQALRRFLFNPIMGERPEGWDDMPQHVKDRWMEANQRQMEDSRSIRAGLVAGRRPRHPVEHYVFPGPASLFEEEKDRRARNR
jgi:hypothetical protein